MNENVILSPMQKKELEEAKAKELQEKREAFNKDLEALCEKHKMVLVPYLNFQMSGILPQVSVMPKPNAQKSQSK